MLDDFAAGLFAHIDDLCCSCGTRTGATIRYDTIGPDYLRTWQPVIHVTVEVQNVLHGTLTTLAVEGQ
jgi:hypothetical protein